jgi:hypothetical protein
MYSIRNKNLLHGVVMYYSSSQLWRDGPSTSASVTQHHLGSLGCFILPARARNKKCATRTPENQPKCIIPGPGKFLRSEGYVCANPGKFGVISDEMYVYNPGISRGWTKVYVIIRGKF